MTAAKSSRYTYHCNSPALCGSLKVEGASYYGWDPMGIFVYNILSNRKSYSFFAKDGTEVPYKDVACEDCLNHPEVQLAILSRIET